MSKHSILLIILLIFAGCSWVVDKTASFGSEGQYFTGKRGCFLLYNVKTAEFEKEIGGEACRERFVACSTFKVPLAVMAFDAALLEDEHQVLPWDGKKEAREEVNRDHDAASWMKYSVVWFSQRLTPLLGEEEFQRYLEDFEYGNEDISAGITTAWLVQPSDPGPALKISAYEQVEFLRKLWADQLPVDLRAMRITRDITYLETSPKGFRMHGKTGSNFYDQSRRQRLGWFIAHLDNGQQEYIAVTNFSDLEPVENAAYGGAEAKEITKQILGDLGVW